MFSWAFRRRFFYLTIVILVIGLPIGFIVWKSLQKPPSCMDGVKNQDEHGVDCGGICQIACMYEVQAEPTIQWSRAYYVTKGVYNLVAYLQNPNTEYISRPVKYTFRVYDENNVVIATREGVVALPTTKLFPIFEPTVDVGERIPKKVSFEFSDQIVWVEYHGEKPELDVTEQKLSLSTSTPTISARIRNKTLNTYKNVEVVAVIYDEKGNGFLASRTYIDSIGDRETATVYFTWPEPFTASSSKIEIIPKLAISAYK
jgi:hypothetical protein